MSYNAQILADSLSPHGHRLTTFIVEYPRIVLPEMLTHRMLSKNTASSRAIPVHKQIEKVAQRPFFPVAFGKNQKGMVAEENIEDQRLAIQHWGDGVAAATRVARGLEEAGVHKQLANRVIEPYTWTTQIITATDWDNFFKLRTAEDAQPEIRAIALRMEDAYALNQPRNTGTEGWHLPLIDADDEDKAFSYHDPYGYLKQISIGRCARVSYLTHDGKRDPDADIELYNRLWKSGHLSPFEHVARPFSDHEWGIINSVRNELGHHKIDAFSKQMVSKMEYVGNLHGWVSERMALECHI